MKHGEGTFTWADGRVYQGQWRAGKQDGAGHSPRWKSEKGQRAVFWLSKFLPFVSYIYVCVYTYIYIYDLYIYIYIYTYTIYIHHYLYINKNISIYTHIHIIFWSFFLQPAPVPQGVLIDTNGRQTKGHWRMGERLRSPEGWGAKGVFINGDTPKNAWFLLFFVRENPIYKWMMTGGSPMTQETTNSQRMIRLRFRNSWDDVGGQCKKGSFSLWFMASYGIQWRRRSSALSVSQYVTFRGHWRLERRSFGSGKYPPVRNHGFVWWL